MCSVQNAFVPVHCVTRLPGVLEVPEVEVCADQCVHSHVLQHKLNDGVVLSECNRSNVVVFVLQSVIICRSVGVYVSCVHWVIVSTVTGFASGLHGQQCGFELGQVLAVCMHCGTCITCWALQRAASESVWDKLGSCFGQGLGTVLLQTTQLICPFQLCLFAPEVQVLQDLLYHACNRMAGLQIRLCGLVFLQDAH